jgi:FkbM family methyltransferase
MQSLRSATAQVFRRLPSFKGKTRAIRVFNWCFNRAKLPPRAVCSLRNGGQLILDLRARTEFIPFYLGEYDFDTYSLIAGFLPPGAVALDVGANIGLYSIPLGLRLQELGGTLYAFEPVPSNFSRLMENLSLNHLNQVVKAERVALSDHESVLKMILRDDFAAGGETGNASVWIDDGRDSSFEKVDVPAIRLDDYLSRTPLSRIDFVKLDIEGHEGEFLRGARESIERFRPVILSEFNGGYLNRRGVDVDALCAEVFAGFDYRFFRRDDRGRWAATASFKGKAPAEDVLLVPFEKVGNIFK